MFLNLINLFTDIGNLLEKMIDDSKGYLGYEDIGCKVYGTMKEKDVKSVDGEKVINRGKM